MYLFHNGFRVGGVAYPHGITITITSWISKACIQNLGNFSSLRTTNVHFRPSTRVPFTKIMIPPSVHWWWARICDMRAYFAD